MSWAETIKASGDVPRPHPGQACRKSWAGCATPRSHLQAPKQALSTRAKGLESHAAPRTALSTHPHGGCQPDLTPLLWPEAWALWTGGASGVMGACGDFQALRSAQMALHPLPQAEGKTSRAGTDGLAFGWGKESHPHQLPKCSLRTAQKDPRLTKARELRPHPCPLGSTKYSSFATSEVLGPRKPPAPAVPVPG